jgi:histidine decarboxylase
MVVFRLKGENELTEKVIECCAPINLIPIKIVDRFQLLKRLNHRGNLHAVPASLKGKYVIRFTVTSTRTTSDDIIKDWNEIRAVASDILEEFNLNIDKRVPLKGSYWVFDGGKFVSYVTKV